MGDNQKISMEDLRITYQIDQVEYETYKTIILSGFQNLLATPINECRFWSESTIQNKMVTIMNTALPKNCYLERYAGYWPDWMTEMEKCMAELKNKRAGVIIKQIVRVLELI